jgi:hypothetical protein
MSKNCPSWCPFVERNYCRNHPEGSLKKPKPIAPRSKKMEQVMKKEYRPQVKEMVEAGTRCAIKSPVCTGVAQGFHHLEGREGKNLVGKKKVPCCNLCNQFIEQNDAYARANGWKLSKHANYKREK